MASLLLGVCFLATVAPGTAETNGIAWFTNYTAYAFRELEAAREEILSITRMGYRQVFRAVIKSVPSFSH